MSQHDEAHTQLTTRELDRQLADAHRRGALEALDKVLAFRDVAALMDWSGVGLCDQVKQIRARYEKPEEAK